jgi:hypothetical protein
MAALIPLLLALAPLLPALEGQIVALINRVQNQGHVTPADEKAINDLMVQVHVEVQAELAKRVP